MGNMNFAPFGFSLGNFGTANFLSTNFTSLFPYGTGSQRAAIHSTQPQTESNSGGLNIHVTYDASVNSCPHEAAFKACVAGVVKYYESQFSDPVTINLHVGWGEVDGDKIPGGSGAESESNYTAQKYSYAQIKAALLNDATSADDNTALASLGSDPTHGGKFSMTTAQAKALGLISGTSTAVDGWTGVDKTTHWVYNTTNTTGADVNQDKGQADLFSFLAHEISEIMGRQMNFGHGNGDGFKGDGYYPEDLFDYTAEGVHSFKASKGGRYFSLDGGVTVIHHFNAHADGDQFDWAPSSTPDSYDWEGSVGAVSKGDLRVMDVLGYDRIGAGAKISTAATLSLPSAVSHYMVIAEQGLVGYQGHGGLMYLHNAMHLAQDHFV